jgi:type VI secretion system protein ImpF
VPPSDSGGVTTLSVLDRLIDAEPKTRSEAMMTSAQSLRIMKAAVRRDLEWLMNTRRTIQEVPEHCVEVRKSVFHYGLPDTTAMGLFSGDDQNMLLKAIETTIGHFEPRLLRPRISLKPVTSSSRIVHFVIEGTLWVDPAPEQIVFDTVLELSNGTYQIQGDAGAR